MARSGTTLDVPCLFALNCAISGPPQVVGRLDWLVLMGSNVERLAIAVFVVNQFQEIVDAILNGLLLPLLNPLVLPDGWNDL